VPAESEDVDVPSDDSRVELLTRIRPAMDAVERLAPPEVVHELADALGAQLVAAIACVHDTKHVRSWEAGAFPEHMESLRAALQATRAIVMLSGNATARAWFVGCSTRLKSHFATGGDPAGYSRSARSRGPSGIYLCNAMVKH
jgi:hypothetical protein